MHWKSLNIKFPIIDWLNIMWKWSCSVAQLCPTLCDPMDCSLPGSTIHEIFQARILEWVAISFYRGSFQPRDCTWVSCIIGRCFTVWASREVYVKYSKNEWNREKKKNLRNVGFKSKYYQIQQKYYFAKLLLKFLNTYS